MIICSNLTVFDSISIWLLVFSQYIFITLLSSGRDIYIEGYKECSSWHNSIANKLLAHIIQMTPTPLAFRKMVKTCFSPKHWGQDVNELWQVQCGYDGYDYLYWGFNFVFYKMIWKLWYVFIFVCHPKLHW